MKIPVFENIKFVDEKGYLTPEWTNIFQELFQGLQANFSEEGLVMPSQPGTAVAAVNPTLDPAPPTLLNQRVSAFGTMVYDKTNNLAKINVNGAWKTITTS